MLPIYIEAEYTDGFVYREDELDQSQFVAGKNVFFDIEQGLPVPFHGPIKRFSLIVAGQDERIDIDFQKLPLDAQPYRLKHMEGDFYDNGQVATRCLQIDFGWVRRDKEGNILDGEIVPVI